MQKIGLLAALVGAVGIAYVAYPKGDRTAEALIRVPGAGHDSSQQSALEKLKSATRVTSWPQEQPSALPAPRVMEQVKQDIQARPVAAPLAPPVQPPITAASATPAVRAEVPPQTAAAPDGLDKLAARLPSGPAVSTTSPTVSVSTSPPVIPTAKTVTSTLVLPSASSAAPVSPPPIAAAPPAVVALPSDERESAKATSVPAPNETTAKASATERRRPTQRAAAAPVRANPETVRRVPRYTSVYRRNDGI